MLRSFLLDGRAGQGLVEYALIIMLVVIVVVAILGVFGTALGSTYSAIMNGLPF
jgi:Flp pilus assembly pilin Flp